jgi:hypothetical protein
MGSPAVLLVAITAAGCPAVFCEPASLSVTIDTGGAQAALQTALADSAHVAEAADRALANPDGIKLHSRLIILVGSKGQNGWVPVQNVPDFYVDLGFHGEDVDSVVNIATHKLFHVVQGKVQPDWTRAFEDAPHLPPTQRGQHRAHAVLLNLLLEGTATYVGDPTLYATGVSSLTPFMKPQHHSSTMNTVLPRISRS